jgi:hypothetical protein
MLLLFDEIKREHEHIDTDEDLRADEGDIHIYPGIEEL